MAKIIIAGGTATSAANSKYISKSKGNEKYVDDKILFNDTKSRISEDQAELLLSNSNDQEEGKFISLVFSLEKKNFARLGETQEERLLSMEEVVRESLGNLWNELGVKDVKWTAGTHLNTNSPHAHIIFNTKAVDLETGEPKNVPKIPRTWFWRENDDNSKIAKFFEAPLAAHTLATPPQIVATKKPETDVVFPVKELDANRIDKTLNRLSEVGGISPHWVEHLTDNQTLYVNRQGALTFVRRDVNGFATGYVYENGYKPEDEQGFFYVGNPKTASRFIVAETPKEVLALLELTGHRDLSEVCIVASDKKNTPVALKNFLREASLEKPMRVIWSLGLNRDDVQEAGDFANLQVELTESRPEKAPSLEFVTWEPKPGYGHTWNNQIQSRNLTGELNGIIKKVLIAEGTVAEPLDEVATKEYYEKVADTFRDVEVVNENNEFVVYSKTVGGIGAELGRYAQINSDGESLNYKIISVGKDTDPQLEALAPSFDETEIIGEIKFLFGEKVSADFLEADRLANPETNQEAEAEEIIIGDAPLTQYADEIIEDVPQVKLSAKEVTERLKEIPLEDVMPLLGLSLSYDSKRREYVYRDNSDTNKIKVKGDLFSDRLQDRRGGKNAINLVMHVQGSSFAEARTFLMDNLGLNYIPQETPDKAVIRGESTKEKVPFIMPERRDDKLPIVHDYLTRMRGLNEEIVNSQIVEGNIFANSFGSSTFVYRTEDGTIKGAAWRATVGNKRGDFTGTEKVNAWFYLGDIKNANRFIITEAPIEAMSYLQLHPETNLKTTAIISTATNSVPVSLINLLERNAGENAELVVAFNNDKGGQNGTDFLLEKIGKYVLLNHKDHHINNLIETTEFSGKILRSVPTLEDWNEDVKAERETENYKTDAEDAGAEMEAIARPEVFPQPEDVQLDSLTISFMEGWHTNPDNTPRVFPVSFASVTEFDNYIQREKPTRGDYKTDVELSFNQGSELKHTFLVGTDLPDTLSGLITRQIEMFGKMKELPSFSDQLEELDAETNRYKFIRNTVETIQTEELKAFEIQDNPDLSPEENPALEAFTPEMIRAVKVSAPLHFKEFGHAEVLLARENDKEPFFNIGYRVRIGDDVIERVPVPTDEKLHQGKQSLSNGYDEIRAAVLEYWKNNGEPRFTLTETETAPDAQKYLAYLLNKTETSARDFSVRTFEKSYAIIPEFSQSELNTLRQWKDRTTNDEYFKIEAVFYKEIPNAKPYQNLMHKLVNAGLVEVRQEGAFTLVKGGNPLTAEAMSYLPENAVDSLKLTVQENRVLELESRRNELATLAARSSSGTDREYYFRQIEVLVEELNSLKELPEKKPEALADDSTAPEAIGAKTITLGENQAIDHQLLLDNPLRGVYDRTAHNINVAFNEAYQKDVTFSEGFEFNYRDRIVTVLDTKENGMLLNFRINDGRSQGKNQNYTLGNLIHEEILSKDSFEAMIRVSRTRQEILSELRESNMNLDYKPTFAPDLTYLPNTTAYRLNSKFSDGDYVLYRNNTDKTTTVFKQNVETINEQKVYSFGEPEAVGIKNIAEVIAHVATREDFFKNQAAENSRLKFAAENKAVAEYLTEKFGKTFIAGSEGNRNFLNPIGLPKEAILIGYTNEYEIKVFRKENRAGMIALESQENPEATEYASNKYLELGNLEAIGDEFAKRLEILHPAEAAIEVQTSGEVIEDFAEEVETAEESETSAETETAPALAAPGVRQLPIDASTGEIERTLTALFNARFAKDNYDFKVVVAAAKDENRAFDLTFESAGSHNYSQYRIYPPSKEFNEWSALKNNYNPIKSSKVLNFELTDKSFKTENGLVEFTAKRIIKNEGLIFKAPMLVPTVLASPQQEGRIEKRIAKLINAHKLGEQIANSEEFYVVLENKPYMDLHITKDYGTNLIRLTHWYIQNGDMMHDGEMNFRLKEGKLSLNQVGVSLYGTPRYSYDRTFANMFSNNLINQGFEKATLVQMKDEESQFATAETVENQIVVLGTGESIGSSLKDAETAPAENVAAEITLEAPALEDAEAMSGRRAGEENHLVSKLMPPPSGNRVELIEAVSMLRTKVWLPSEIVSNHITEDVYTFNDTLSNTGRTATIYTEQDANDFKAIQGEALSQLGLEGEFSDSQIESQRENAELYAEAVKLQNKLDESFAAKDLRNPFFAVADTNSSQIEINGKTLTGKPDGMPLYSFYETELRGNYQIGVGNTYPMSQYQPEDFYFRETDNYIFEYDNAVAKLTALLSEETNISQNRIESENRVELGSQIEPAGVKKGTIALAEEVREILHSGASIGNNVAFNKMAERNFGGSRAQGTFDARDAYDSLELGVNLYLLDRAKTHDFFAKPEETLREMRDLLRRLPTQSDRTDEQNLFQQFSTPPTEGFSAYVALGAKKGDFIVEPSAGNAGLAIWAKMQGVKIHVNEISDRRAGILKILGFNDVTRKDAQFLNDTLDRNIKPTLVLMNPPFSSTGGRTANNRTKYGAEHITDALTRLAPGGRLVAIVGEGMGFGKQGFTQWWSEVFNKYTVRANVGVPGEEYGKYGTTFGNQILVIDKIGATPGKTMQEQLATVIKGDMPNLEMVLTQMSEIAATRPESKNFGVTTIPEAKEVSRQTMLLPETLDLSPLEAVWFVENQDNLSRLGYEAVALNDRTIAIKTSPTNIEFDKVRENFMNSLSALGNKEQAPKPDTNTLPLEVAERELETKNTEKVFDIGAGYMGNGLTVWNRAEEENKDYKNIAHIGEKGVITIYEEDMPESAILEVYAFALDGNREDIEIIVPYEKENKIIAYAGVNKKTGEITSIGKNFQGKANQQILIKNEFAKVLQDTDELAPELLAGLERFKAENAELYAALSLENTPAANTTNAPQETYRLAREEATGAIIGRVDRLEARGYRIAFGEANAEIKDTLVGILSGHYADKFIGKDLTIEPITFERIERQDFISRADLKGNPDKIYLFGDNLRQTGLGGQAKEMRGEPNAIGIPTKINPNNNEDSFFNDNDLIDNKIAINEAVAKLARYSPDTVIVIPTAGLGTGLAALEEKAPQTFAYLQETLSNLDYNTQFTEEEAQIEIKNVAQTISVGSTQETVSLQMSILAAVPVKERELEINNPLEAINLYEAGAILSRGVTGYSEVHGGEMDTDWEESQIARLIITGATENQVVSLIKQFEDVTQDVAFTVDGRDYELSVTNNSFVETVLAVYQSDLQDDAAENEAERAYELDEDIDYGGYVAEDDIEEFIAEQTIGNVSLNEKELAAFAAAAQQILDQTGGQFGYLSDAKTPEGMTREQFAGYTGSLTQKGLIHVSDDEYKQLMLTSKGASELRERGMFDDRSFDLIDGITSEAVKQRETIKETVAETSDREATIYQPALAIKNQLAENLENIGWNKENIVLEINQSDKIERPEVLVRFAAEGRKQSVALVSQNEAGYIYQQHGASSQVLALDNNALIAFLKEDVLEAAKILRDDYKNQYLDILGNRLDKTYSKTARDLNFYLTQQGHNELSANVLVKRDEQNVEGWINIVKFDYAKVEKLVIGRVFQGTDQYQYIIGDQEDEVYNVAELSQHIIEAAEREPARELQKKAHAILMLGQESANELIAEQKITPERELNLIPAIDLKIYEAAMSQRPEYELDADTNFTPEEVRADYFKEIFAYAESVLQLDQKTATTVYLNKKDELGHKKNVARLGQDKSDLAYHVSETGEYFGEASENYIRRELEDKKIIVTKDYEILVGKDRTAYLDKTKDAAQTANFDNSFDAWNENRQPEGAPSDETAIQNDRLYRIIPEGDLQIHLIGRAVKLQAISEKGFAVAVKINTGTTGRAGEFFIYDNKEELNGTFENASAAFRHLATNYETGKFADIENNYVFDTSFIENEQYALYKYDGIGRPLDNLLEAKELIEQTSFAPSVEGIRITFSESEDVFKNGENINRVFKTSEEFNKFIESVNKPEDAALYFKTDFELSLTDGTKFNGKIDIGKNSLDSFESNNYLQEIIKIDGQSAAHLLKDYNDFNNLESSASEAATYQNRIYNGTRILNAIAVANAPVKTNQETQPPQQSEIIVSGENLNGQQHTAGNGLGTHSAVNSGTERKQPNLFEQANSVNESNAGYERGNADVSVNERQSANGNGKVERNQPASAVSSADTRAVGKNNSETKGIVSGSNPGESATGVNVIEEISTQEIQENITTAALGIGRNTEKRERIDNLGVVEYKPAKLTKGVAHPGDIVESASMAAVVTPDITYTPKLDKKIIEEGLLSSLQLETVIYAGQRHEMRLGDGSRAGFFIGDGTGVGKGRELAGIALDNWNQGRKRVLWLSINYDLVPSTERDMKGLGAADVPFHTLNKHSVHADLEQSVGDGLLFASYATLTGKGKDGSTRFDQIVKWLGEDGVIMFDEGHLAKNAVSFGQAEASQRGEAVVDLQVGDKSNPNWRIVYSSATGATELRNMAYMQRLGLWGEGSGFPGGFIEFHNTIDKGGVGSMEMVARDMKAAGMYCSRSLSMRGVDYRSVHHALTPEQRDIYNIAARAWSDVARGFDDALKHTNANGKAKGMAYARLYSGQQMFFRQLMTAMKVPALIQETERVQREGSSYVDPKTGETKQVPAQVVIGVIGTGEARTKEQVSKAMQFGLDLDTLDFSPKQILLNVVESAFPTKRFTEETDPMSGKTIKVPVVDEDGRQVESQEALEMRDALLGELEERVTLPDNPLDQIVNYFGESAVAEITGRNKRIIIDPETGQRQYVKRAREGVAMDKASQDEMLAFQAGRKGIAIISQSASTGISLHAEVKPILADYVAGRKLTAERAAKIQAEWDKSADVETVREMLGSNDLDIFRRIHITLETAWSADTQMQTFGRTHRSNEMLPPEYVLMSTDLGGEKRFLATIAKRLGSLGALTKGDREQAGGGNLLEYDFENKYGTEAAKKIITSMRDGKPAFMTTLPVDPHTGEERGGMEILYTMGLAKRDGNLYTVPEKTLEDLEVSKFLNRVLMLDVDTQNAVFDGFVQEMEAIITHDKELGLFDEGVKDIKGENIRLAEEPKVVSTDKTSGAETLYYKVNADTPTMPITLEHIEDLNKIVRFAGMESIVPVNKGVFYQQRNSKNIIYTSYASTRAEPTTGSMVKHYKFARPSGWQSQLLTEKDLLDKYVPVRLEERREFADEKVMSVKDWWNKEVSETPNSHVQDYHLIAGAVLPVWQRLASTNEKGDQMSLKTVRIETEDGMRIVGVEIPSRHINRVLRDLGVQQSFKTPDEIFDAVLDTKETVDLVGGIKLRATFLKKQPAIEIMNLSIFQKNEFQNFGAQKEIISFSDKYFVPTDRTKGVDVLGKVLERYPAVDKSADKGQEQIQTENGENKTNTLAAKIEEIQDIFAGKTLGGGALAKVLETNNTFSKKADAIRGKQLSYYQSMIEAITNEKGQVLISAGAYEFLRVAYNQTFHEDLKKTNGLQKFEGLFNDPDNADRFMNTLDYMEKNCGIYCENISSLNKTLVEARQMREDNALILITNESGAMHEEIHASAHINSLGKDLIERHARFEELTQTEAYTIAKPILAAKLYTDNDGLLVEETFAYIASGEAEKIGLLPEDAADFGELWFTSFAERNGELSINEFKELTDESKSIRDRAYRTIQIERATQEQLAERKGRESGDGRSGFVENEAEREQYARSNIGAQQQTGSVETGITTRAEGEFNQGGQMNRSILEQAFAKGERLNAGMLYKLTDESEEVSEEFSEILESYGMATTEGNNVETLAEYVREYPEATEELISFAADRDLIRDERYDEMTPEEMQISAEARFEMYAREVSRLTDTRPIEQSGAMLYKTLDQEVAGQIKGDEIFTDFQSIIKEAGLEKLLESKDGRAEFETVGEYPTRYNIEITGDEIKFSEVFVPELKYVETEPARGITFGKNSTGNFQYTGSYTIEDKNGTIAQEFDKANGYADVQKWQSLGNNLVVCNLDLEGSLQTAVEEANRANLEKYLSRQLGKELVAEIEVRKAEFELTRLTNNRDDERLKVIARIGEKLEQREISFTDLERERTAIARSNVNTAKTTGVLEMIAEDEGKTFEAVEKSQYGKELGKAEAMQEPWMNALNEAVSKETARLEEISENARLILKDEKSETKAVAVQTGIVNLAEIKPTLSPEKVWLEQIKAVKRYDAETFSELEEINRAAGLPRPNDVYSRLRGMETIAAMNARQENKMLAEWTGQNKTDKETIVVNVRAENGELKIENWRVKEVEQRHDQLTAQAAENRKTAADERAAAHQSALQPLINKINPAAAVQGKLGWIVNPKETFKAHLNPIEVIKNDPAMQVIRAVAGYIKHKGKENELNKIADAATREAKFLREQFASGVADNAEKLHSAVKSAIDSEESLRTSLRTQPSINARLLEKPELGLTDAELKEVGRIAMETGDVAETREFYNLVKKDRDFAEAIGETKETLTAKSLLSEARAAWQAKQSIAGIKTLPDGSIDVEINSAQFNQAIDSLQTADEIGEIQSVIAGQSVVQTLSLEEAATVEQFLTGNNEIADSLNAQISNLGQDLMKTLQPPLNATEQELFKQMAFNGETLNRFESITRSEQFLDKMAIQASVGTANEIPFQMQAHNLSVTNPNDALEARETEFWKNDRTEREAQIAGERAAQRLEMTDEEKAEIDAAELNEAQAMEIAEVAEVEEVAEVAVLIL